MSGAVRDVLDPSVNLFFSCDLCEVCLSFPPDCCSMKTKHLPVSSVMACPQQCLSCSQYVNG